MMRLPQYILLRYHHALDFCAPTLINAGRGFGPIIEGALEAAKASYALVGKMIRRKGLTREFAGECHGVYTIASPEEFRQLIAATQRYDADAVGFYSNLQATSYRFRLWSDIGL